MVAESRLEISNIGGYAFRNSVGQYMDGDRVIKYGLCSKSSDIIGLTPVVITQEMVGQTIAVFTAIECKNGNWKPNKKLTKHEEGQKNFIDMVINNGGIAGFANSANIAISIVREFVSSFNTAVKND